MKFLLVSGTGIAVMCGKVGGAKVEEGNARRIAALWNMAERLGLSTEAIEGGVIDDMLKMLTELQECAEYWSEYDVPLGIKERLDEVIKKARGGNA